VAEVQSLYGEVFMILWRIKFYDKIHMSMSSRNCRIKVLLSSYFYFNVSFMSLLSTSLLSICHDYISHTCFRKRRETLNPFGTESLRNRTLPHPIRVFALVDCICRPRNWFSGVRHQWPLARKLVRAVQ